ncbi:MAG: efflux RND transporter periplasmic adaptor subunit [Cyanobacteria bacterium]|jgi:cobalt-zinc-cadmium efflux system membrane fusion protein|nr:efflux RND transporter periplasmic adaptor subunit [Cyanobacteriota bacterium]
MQTPEEVDVISQEKPSSSKQGRGWLVALIAIGLAGILSGVLWFMIASRSSTEEQEPAKPEASTQSDSIELKKEEAHITLVSVSAEAPIVRIRAVGTVEANEQQVQQISSLAAGRVKSVNVALGDYVQKFTPLVTIESPQVAEMHGKLHEAETRLKLALVTLDRVKQTANKVAILKAKASLDEADSTLKRTKQLVSEGLTAGKDLVAAESEYKRATAEYNFQKDISLNREVAEATAAVQTAQTEVDHIRDSLTALDAQLPKHNKGQEHEISKLELRSPISGVVTERLVNPGAGVEAGNPLLTIANISTLWVIANVPEADMPSITLGMPAKVFLDGKVIRGRVNYIDPRLNEDTRTSRVRVEIDNPKNLIRSGAFAQVEFSHRFRDSKKKPEVFVPTSSVQNMENRKVVFVSGSDDTFRVRTVTTGEEIAGMVPILTGLKAGERVAADGSFVLKSKLLKDQLGDED